MPLIDQLFEVLPQNTLSVPIGRVPKLRTWVWDDMRPYNGFTHIERVRNWQVMWWLMDCGVLPYPSHCDICGTPKSDTVRIGYHAECYFALDRMPPLCDDCHRRIHQRMRHPDPWLEIVAAHSRTGQEWFAILPTTDQPDIATWQRRRFPDADPSDLFSGLMFALPNGVPVPDELTTQS